jgi:hypothetical protein
MVNTKSVVFLFRKPGWKTKGKLEGNVGQELDDIAARDAELSHNLNFWCELGVVTSKGYYQTKKSAFWFKFPSGSRYDKISWRISTATENIM